VKYFAECLLLLPAQSRFHIDARSAIPRDVTVSLSVSLSVCLYLTHYFRLLLRGFKNFLWLLVDVNNLNLSGFLKSGNSNEVANSQSKFLAELNLN